ncbi:MAG: regulatory iron-sulfur-containing complex subunit RicT [candidate division WOR-3 bacterium]
MSKVLVEIHKFYEVFCNPIDEMNFKEGDFVLLKLKFGEELGRVKSFLENEEEVKGVILRKADQKDILKYLQIREKEREYYKRFVNFLYDKGMNNVIPIACYYSFDEKRLICYAISNKKIDLTSIQKEFGKLIGKRAFFILLPPRETMAKIGGYGPCGRRLCCATFLKEPPHVQLRTVRIQGLEEKREKITGFCGRLLCCLEFEKERYEKQ